MTKFVQVLAVIFMALSLAANVVGCGGGGGHGGNGGGGGGGGGPTALTLSVLSGANQSAPDGMTLPQPIVFSVIDENGNGVTGATITIGGAAPDGATQAATGTTVNGSASTTVTLNHGCGIYGFSAQASLNGVSSSLINFMETGTATVLGAAKIAGDNQTVTAGATITLRVKIVDQIGAPAVGATTLFAVNGTNPQPGTITDSKGEATFSFTTTTAGTYTTIANASRDGVISNAVTFTDTAQ